jgi:hypothetical protein
MITISDRPQQTLGSDHGGAQPIEEHIAGFFSEAERARSARNISVWQSYLPPDCVQSMINMGWDHST